MIKEIKNSYRINFILQKVKFLIRKQHSTFWMIKTNKSTLKQKLIEENKVSNKSNMFYINSFAFNKINQSF